MVLGKRLLFVVFCFFVERNENKNLLFSFTAECDTIFVQAEKLDILTKGNYNDIIS